jgi:hypothetical protein
LGAFPNQSVIEWTLKDEPFVLRFSKHEGLSDAPFDELRVNGARQREGHRG